MAIHKPHEINPTTGEYGLQTLFEPSESKPTVDIVFIHSLTGNRTSTWTDPKSTAFWPSSLLPTSLPPARILTFGYAAAFTHFLDPSSPQNLATHSLDLLTALASSRTGSSELHRPLIFIAHSLGGQVVEQALLLCHDEPDDKSRSAVLFSTVGIVYLGTPHVGTDLVRWERTLMLLGMMLHGTDEHVEHVLRPGAKMLCETDEQWAVVREARGHAGKKVVQGCCFYEMNGVENVGLVVPWHSAALQGLPCEGIRGDHISIARFPSKEDKGYMAVVEVIEKWIAGIVKA